MSLNVEKWNNKKIEAVDNGRKGVLEESRRNLPAAKDRGDAR